MAQLLERVERLAVVEAAEADTLLDGDYVVLGVGLGAVALGESAARLVLLAAAPPAPDAPAEQRL